MNWEAESSLDGIPILSQGDNTSTHRPSKRVRDESDVAATTQSTPRARAYGASKSIHDSIHDHITLHPLLVAIIDTPQFQRLRSVNQLSVVHMLFPGGVHTRFEHSVGTSHLANKMVSHLQNLHAGEIDISDRDVLCVSIAGLCHDLGHGPFSHLFELYINEARTRLGRPKWHHEDCSLSMVRYLIKENNIPLADYGISEEDINFVCALIRGLKPNEAWPSGIGRTEDKRFLFEIVSNKRNGIDVDKLDYFLRDSMHCYGRLPVDVNVDRIIKCSRVLLCDRQYQICFEQKVALSLGDVFSLRAKLHKYVYQHRVALILQQMVLDFLMKSDALTIHGVKLYDVVDNMAVYTMVGDWIMPFIASTSDPALAEARAIIHRIHTRQLYSLVGHVVLRNDERISETDLLPYLVGQGCTRDDFFITTANIKYASEVGEGGKIEDPLNHVRFFNPKDEILQAHPLHVRHMGGLFSPSVLVERTAFVCVREGAKSGVVYDALQQWREARGTLRDSGDTSAVRGNVNTPSKRQKSGLTPLHTSTTGLTPPQ
eukprot:PhM_4_TR16672/c0_g1_i1/m.92996